MKKVKGKRVNKNKLPPFVPILWEVLNSKAYHSLPYAAAKALTYFLGKVKLPYNDSQRLSAEFAFSYSEAKSYGFALATFSKVIKDLINFGFEREYFQSIYYYSNTNIED